MSLTMRRILPPLLLASTLAAQSLELEALTPRFGVALVANGVPTTDSAAGPVTGTLGADFTLPFGPGSTLSLEPGFDLYSYHSELLEAQPSSGPVLDLPRAVPAPAESASASWTQVLVLYSPLVARFRLGETFTALAGAGPALLFRLAAGGPDPLELNAWYFGKARLLHAEARIGFEFELAPRLSLAGDVRGLYPLANLWTDPDPAMTFDGAILRIGLGMRLEIGESDGATTTPGAGSDSAGVPATGGSSP